MKRESRENSSIEPIHETMVQMFDYVRGKM